MLECCYNVSGERDKDKYRWHELVSHDRLNRGDVFNLAVELQWNQRVKDITPLWRGEEYGVINLQDGGVFDGVQATYSLKTNLDLTLGTLLFATSNGDKLDAAHKIHSAQLAWYF